MPIVGLEIFAGSTMGDQVEIADLAVPFKEGVFGLGGGEVSD